MQSLSSHDNMHELPLGIEIDSLPMYVFFNVNNFLSGLLLTSAFKTMLGRISGNIYAVHLSLW